MYSDREEVYLLTVFVSCELAVTEILTINQELKDLHFDNIGALECCDVHNLHLSAEKACNPARVYLSDIVVFCSVFVAFCYLMLIHQLLVEKLHYI